MNKFDIKEAIYINGEKCTTKENLFVEFSKKLDFPDYFGNNWDSFEEILFDLEVNSKILLYNFEELLKQDNENKIIFNEIIQSYNSEKENQFYKITTI